MNLIEWIAKNIDLSLWMRFIITLLVLHMLYRALFTSGAQFDEAFKNVLVMLTTMTVGYFFSTSKGSTDKTTLLEKTVAPSTTTTTQVDPSTTTVTTETTPTTTTIEEPKP